MFDRSLISHEQRAMVAEQARLRRRTVIGMASAASVAALLGPAGARARSTDPQTILSGPEGVLPYLTRLEPFGFAGALLVARGPDVLHASAHGMADRASGAPWTLDTIFDTGSLAKQFTAAAILALMADGKLAPTDAVSDHLEGVPADKRGITLHHLLTHTSGLANDAGPDYDRLSRADFLRRVLKAPLDDAPGARHAYSNVGYGLLAAVVEQVSKTDIDTFLRRRLFEPAGMDSSGYWITADDLPRISRGYTDGEPRSFREQGLAAGRDLWNLIGNGGLHSTLRDLQRWNRALDNDSVLPEAVRRRLFQPHVVAASDYAGTGTPLYYGYGWYVWPDGPQGPVAWHLGGNGTLNAAIRRHGGTGRSLVYASNVSEFHDPAYPVPAVERLMAGESVETPPQLRADGGEVVRSLGGRYTGESGSELILSPNLGRLSVLGCGQSAYTFVRTGEWRADPHMEAMNAATLKLMEASRDRRFADLLAFYPANDTLQDITEFESAFWRRREALYGSLQGLRVIGSRPGRGRIAGLTVAAFDFDRGVAWREYSWADDGRISDLAPLDAGPSALYFPAEDGLLVSFNAARATAIRLRAEPAGSRSALIVPGPAQGHELVLTRA